MSSHFFDFLQTHSDFKSKFDLIYKIFSFLKAILP